MVLSERRRVCGAVRFSFVGCARGYAERQVTEELEDLALPPEGFD
jgi:hypothetical protein